MNELLRFYFGEKYIGSNRIKVFCGDLLNERFDLSRSDYSYLCAEVDTVINCAASVKHYGVYEYFRKMNVLTVERLIEFAKSANANLIHASTLSISGNGFEKDFASGKDETVFSESSLYIHQLLDNMYARSKFEAEKLIFEQMQTGLKACIMRMGNLTNRSDGKFQINCETNAFAMRMKSIVELGMLPEKLLNSGACCDFTPIDEAASAVMLVTRHFDPTKTVFHISNSHPVRFAELVEYMNTLGIRIEAVENSVFENALRKTMEQSETEHIFESFVMNMAADANSYEGKKLRIDNGFSVSYLQKLGFEWEEIGIDYLKKYFDYFRQTGYFGG